MEPLLGHISKNQVRFVRSLQQKKVRDEEKLFVAEGDKCIGELLGHFDLVTLVVTGNPTPLLLYSSTPLLPYSPTPLLATPQELSQMSSLKTPQGSLAVFRQKDPTPLLPYSSTPKQALTLALDGVQDPGNLGTIIRTADWFGIRDIYCSYDTTDCYNPKVVQATMGALARVNIHYVDLVEWIKVERESGKCIYGTVLDGRNIYEQGAIPDATKGIIIMGNEGNGISAEVRKFITHPLYIPSYSAETIESLNVAIATAITLAEFRRLSQQK